MITIYGVYFIIYIALSVFYAFYAVASVKSKNKLIDFSIIFWLMTHQIFKSGYAWVEAPKLGMFRKIDLLIVWFLITVIILQYISKDNLKIKKKILSYEKYLYLYITLSVILYQLHDVLGNISSSKATAFSRMYIGAGLFYYSVSKLLTKELIKSIFKTVIFLSVVSSLVSMIQFFIDSKFFRLAAFYDAFGRYDRASGVFMWPYDNGMFLVLGIFIVAYTIKNLRIKIILISLFLLSMVLVFTRGIWLAFIAVSLVHLFVYYREMMKKLFIAIPIIVFLTIGVVGTYIAQKEFFTGEAWTERILVDTVSVRIALYEFVLRSLPNKWVIGYGDLENNDVYFKGMVNARHGLLWAMGRRGGIHNVILTEAFLRGIFPPIIFIIFFIKFFIFSFKESFGKRNYFYCIPNYFTMSFFFYVFSVGAYLTSRSGYITILFFAITSGVYHKGIDVSGLTFSMKRKHIKNNSEHESKNSQKLLEQKSNQLEIKDQT